MLVLKERILNVPVMSLQTGAQVAYTTEPVIDPRRLAIVAFYCDGPTLDVRPAVLHFDDIREFSNLGFIVDSSDNIMSPNDLVRLKYVLDIKFTLMGKQVVEENGHKVGKVGDYTIDTNSFYIMQLHVQPGLLQSFSSADIIIGRNQIIEVNDSQIVVSSAVIHSEETQTAPRLIVENPFRTHPQAEATRSVSDDA